VVTPLVVVYQDSTSPSATVAGPSTRPVRRAPTPRYGTWPREAILTSQRRPRRSLRL